MSPPINRFLSEVMVLVDISIQPTVLDSTWSDVATLVSPGLGAAWLWMRHHTGVMMRKVPSLTVKCGEDGTGRNHGTRGTLIASSQGERKATTSMDDSKRTTLVELTNSQESFLKDNARVKAQYRVEHPQPKAWHIAAIYKLYSREYRDWSVVTVKIAAERPFKNVKAIFEWFRKRFRLRTAFSMENYGFREQNL